jgi:DNA-binding MarR family transcriptional regulator
MTAVTHKEELIQSVLMVADTLFRRLLPAVPKELLTLEVSMSQLKVMLLLFINGPMNMSAIAFSLDVTLPTASSLIDRLSEKGYIERENISDDRRVVLCRLSDEGQKAIDRIWDSGRARSREILEKMDIANLEMFSRVLSAMIESAKEG